MLKQPQSSPATRKPATTAAAMAVSTPGGGSPGSPNGSLPPAGSRSQERPGAGRGRSIVKGLQPPVFEGIYNNSRMLHFLTAVVGSTCDVKVKNGTTYQGIFKTLSSKFELAIDAVHKKTSEQVPGPKREEIVDTMIFKHSDVMLIHFHNVDFSYATKDKFTDSAIAMNSKVNGEHKDKVLMRWDGGETSDDYDLDSDVSNGWDANEMFKINEDIYGVKTTYDSSLSSYTVPLEKDNSEEFRQREARATLLAREIESSPQYRARIAIENDECRTEEEKHSAVQRPSSDRDSPSFGSRDGKYNPLPQRVRDGSRGTLRTNSSRGGRSGMGMTSRAPPQHYPDASSSPIPEQRGINGGPSRMSPKSQRPIPRSTKPMSSPSSRPIEVSTSPSGSSRVYTPLSPKSATSVSSMDSSSQSSTPDSRPAAEASISTKPASPKNIAPILEGKDAQVTVKEPSRAMELSSPCEIAKPPCKVLQTEQKRNQLDELRKFGAEFRLQATPCPDASIDSFSSRQQREQLESKMAPMDPVHLEIPESRDLGHKIPESVEETKEEQRICESNERQEEAASPAIKADAEEKEEQVVCDQVKKSTLNPNAKEFNPTKILLAVNKATSTPTSPGPRSHSSTTTIPMLTAGQSGVYSPYISYINPLHMSPAVQAPQMYPYAVSNSVPGQQGKFRTKGPPQRSDQQNSATSLMQAAAAAGPPLVAATPYPSYISYSPQQFPGQPTMMQPMAHYPSQPVFAQMLQGNPRMIASGSHPQALVSSSNPQYQPTEQPTPQTLYATVHQSYSHHAPQLHPQPASTPTQSPQQSQHANPSPVQHQAGQPPHLGSAQPQQNLYHTAALTGTPPSLTPGPTAQSPQNSYPQQAVYAIHAHQQLQHGYANMSHVAQAHLQTGVTGAPPHPGAPHPSHPGAPHPTPVMLLHPSQTHGGPPQAAVSQTGVSTPSPYTYIPHPQVQSHPSQQLPFHPPGN